MTNQEKILDLLLKENLSSDEKKILMDTLANDSSLANYKVIYEMLNNLKINIHLNSDLVSEYVLYKSNLPLEDSSIIKFIPQIEKHISTCSKCMQEFNMFNEELIEIDSYITPKFESKTSQTTKQTKVYSLFTKKYFYAAAAAIAFLTFTLFDVSQLTVPSYKNISELSELTNISSTRGRVSSDFHNGIRALNDGNYNDAITMLREDIKINANDETIFYTNYMLGLIYLKKSEVNFLGLFKSFSQTDLDSSISNFELAISKNNLEAFSNINYNSYFYIGKVHLMSENFEEALKYLQVVVDKRGSYSKNAEELIEIIKSKM